MPSNARLFCSRESALNALPALRSAAAAAALPLLLSLIIQSLSLPLKSLGDAYYTQAVCRPPRSFAASKTVECVLLLLKMPLVCPAPASSDDREARPVASNTGCREYGWDVLRLKGSKTPPIATLPSPPLPGHEGWNWRKRDIGSRITMDMNAAPGAVEEYVGSMARPQAPFSGLRSKDLLDDAFPELRDERPKSKRCRGQLPVGCHETVQSQERDDKTAARDHANPASEGTTTETVQVVERNYEETTLAKEAEPALRRQSAANHHHAARPQN
ncbi:hypothetical protein CPLU01_02659 [Colletotrichum plurivorum]|uniref:Uncharacterized protein n=1 Tax=Colletotrichum plurivorum TaxID=2175906 RepID=A0A8H6NMN5_9PEZI|nr:hypothetical protein CPLU01_02659 [Colletotrichum plurivorum]